MRRSARLALAGIAVAAVMAAQGHAGIINYIDQQNTVGGDDTTAATVGVGFGQSFTPTYDRVQAVEVGLRTVSSTTVRVDLYVGTGYAGLLLGSSDTTTFNNVGFAQVHFDFAGFGINITPGAVHTFHFVNTMGGDYVAEGTAAGAYAGGTVIAKSGAVDVGDLRFTEGLHNIPEPSSLVLWSALGLMGLAGARRRKRQAAAPATTAA